jgi:hypothetical protein
MGSHTFRHSVGTMLAEMGEHQLTIRDYMRPANLSLTNKYLQATATSKHRAQNKLVEAILPSGILGQEWIRHPDQVCVLMAVPINPIYRIDARVEILVQ